MKFELFNDHFENAKRYNIPRAQLIIADIPYNLGDNAYASDPRWYKDGDNTNGESKLAGSGATLRAAIEMNRSAYGFEIKKEFYKKAKEQMLSSYQPSLF